VRLFNRFSGGINTSSEVGKVVAEDAILDVVIEVGVLIEAWVEAAITAIELVIIGSSSSAIKNGEYINKDLTTYSI
jgi:hypothetical protein